MTPALVSDVVVRRPHVPNRMWDRMFFTTMILLLWATILFGFARTYFLAGMVLAPLPDLLIHIHGAAFTLWMILLLVQTTLITTKKIQVHRRLGMFTFGLSVAMVALGLFAAVDALRRHAAPPPLDPRTFFVIPVSDMLAFSVLVFFAYWFRNKPEWHKRIILMATIAIVDAGVGRWPVAILQAKPPLQDLVIPAFIVALVMYDMVSLRRVSKATIWPALWLIVIHLARIPVGQTHWWVSMAGRLQQG